MKLTLLWLFAGYATVAASRAIDTRLEKGDSVTGPSGLLLNGTSPEFDRPFSKDFSSSGLRRSTHVFTSPLATDEEWSKAVCKGGQLVRAMAANDAEAGQLFSPQRDSMQSNFEATQQELEGWGYFLYDGVQQFGYDPSSGLWGATRVLTGLGVSVPTVWEGGKNEVLVASHGDKLARDDEGPIPFNEQVGYKRRLSNGQEKEYPVN